MTTLNVATATTKALLAFFNEHTGGNKLVKFQNRASAEARVTALIAEMAAEAQGDQKAAIAACKRGDDAIPAPAVDHTSANKRIAKLLASAPAFNHGTSEGRKAAIEHFATVTEAEHAAHCVETVKPYIRAKAIVADCIAKGITTRKEILAACVAQGIKMNTADGAHYEMCVRKA